MPTPTTRISLWMLWTKETLQAFTAKQIIWEQASLPQKVWHMSSKSRIQFVQRVSLPVAASKDQQKKPKKWVIVRIRGYQKEQPERWNVNIGFCCHFFRPPGNRTCMGLERGLEKICGKRFNNPILVARPISTLLYRCRSFSADTSGSKVVLELDLQFANSLGTPFQVQYMIDPSKMDRKSQWKIRDITKPGSSK